MVDAPVLKIHVFERAGLGLAPFKCIGAFESKYQACHGAPIQPGSSCHYCGTGIIQVYLIRSADGKEFHVGCDCVAKTGDEGLRKTVSQLEAKARFEKARVKAQANKATVDAILQDSAACDKLHALPHPQFTDSTLLAWVEWMRDHAGQSGIQRVVSTLKKAGLITKEGAR